VGNCIQGKDWASFAEDSHCHLNTGKITGSSGVAHTHNQGVTGAGSSHHHVISAEAAANAFITDFSVSEATSGAGSSHVHAQGATGAGSSHQHAMGLTGYEEEHTHGQGTTGTGSSHTHAQGATGAGSSHQHAMGLTGYENEHTHAQGATGAGSSHHHVISAVAVANAFIKDFSVSEATSGAGSSHVHTQGATGAGSEHYHELATTLYEVIDPDTLWGTFDLGVAANEDPAHIHTINYVADHPHTGVAEAAHSDHIVTTEPGEPVEVQYGIHEEAAVTTLELLVNSEVVASNYVGDQTDIRIDGYLSTGNNTVEIRPIVGENAKKGSCTILATGIFFIEAKR
jgi:hypothetical protein